MEEEEEGGKNTSLLRPEVEQGKNKEKHMPNPAKKHKYIHMY
jgi:hypothetical protein